MKQTLTKIKNLFTNKAPMQQSRENIPKRFYLEPVASPLGIPKKDIAERAFMIWQERGSNHGNDREDWLLAKLQLEDELN